MTDETAQPSSKERFTALPTAEEYALFREAYAETYPVRPLLNAIAAKDAELERLTRERDEAQERFEELRDVVYNEANVDRERLRAALADIAVEAPTPEDLWAIEIAREALRTGHETEPAPMMSADGGENIPL